jgi:cell division initiation protein
MAVTPNEISNKEFKKTFRGYDIDEVDDFLESIVEDYDKIFKENITLKEKISALNEKIEHYANMESTLQSTLLLAQSAADQAKENSKKEADLILKDAQDSASSIIRKAEEKVMDVNKEFEMLKQQFNMFKSSFKALLEAQLESVDRTDINTNKQHSI